MARLPITLLGTVLPMTVNGPKAQVVAQDSLALVALYNAADEPNGTNNTIRIILLSGTLPLSLTNLTNLRFFAFSDTDLCKPSDPAFQAGVRTMNARKLRTARPCWTLLEEQPGRTPPVNLTLFL